MTLFIVRAGLLDRSMLPEIEKFYADKTYKNMSVILNGTEVAVGGTAINMAISMGTSMAMQDTEKMKSEEKRIQDVAL